MLRCLPSIQTGKWIEFQDRNGYGYAQPDFFVVKNSHVLVFEAKLTQCQDGYSQLTSLYCPLLEELCSLPAVGVVVCKGLVNAGISRVVADFTELSEAIEDGEDLLTWHFLG